LLWLRCIRAAGDELSGCERFVFVFVFVFVLLLVVRGCIGND